MEILAKSPIEVFLVMLVASAALFAQSDGSSPDKPQNDASVLDARQIVSLSNRGHRAQTGKRVTITRTWSVMRIGAYSITGNGGAGVRLGDLSFSFFDAGNVTGNLGGTDVVCGPQFSATRGALPASNIGGGTTNCSEP